MPSQCGAKALEFIVKEKERFVLENGPAYRVTELVAHVGILRLGGSSGRVDRIEPVARASKAVVAAKPIGVKVQAVGPALGDYVDDSSGIRHILR